MPMIRKRSVPSKRDRFESVDSTTVAALVPTISSHSDHAVREAVRAFISGLSVS